MCWETNVCEIGLAAFFYNCVEWRARAVIGLGRDAAGRDLWGGDAFLGEILTGGGMYLRVKVQRS
jgi:hypothetical protein